MEFQQSLFDYVPPKTHFSGATYSVKHDFKRLNGQLLCVFLTMRDGCWRTLGEISDLTGFPEQSISARLRDFRKEENGKHTVNRQSRGNRERGLFEYQLIPNPSAPSA